MPEKEDVGPEIVIIAAVAEENRVIGRDRDLPWHIPEDLRRFKRLTTGRPLLMGRKTFESIIHQFGRPLPNRRNVVISSRGMIPEHPDVEVCRSIEEALERLRDEELIFIGGGAEIYRQFVPLADRMELTLVQGTYEGDTYFPEYEHLLGDTFVVAAEEPHEGFRFVTYVRR